MWHPTLMKFLKLSKISLYMTKILDFCAKRKFLKSLVAASQTYSRQTSNVPSPQNAAQPLQTLSVPRGFCYKFYRGGYCSCCEFKHVSFKCNALLKKNPLFYSKKYWQLGRQEIYCKFTGSVK